MNQTANSPVKGNTPPVPPLRAYADSTHTKPEALALMREHKRLDHIIQRTYGEGTGADFKGCLVGCATGGDHMLFEPAFGIPRRLAWLADDIFEGLAPAAAADFAVDFFEAIEPGADLGRVYDGWCAGMLGDPTDGLVAISTEPRLAAMAALFARAYVGDEPSDDEWQAAAWDASAASAAWAAKQRDALLRLLSIAAGTGTLTNPVPAASEGQP